MVVMITGVVDTVEVAGAVVEAVDTEAVAEVVMVVGPITSKMLVATMMKHLFVPQVEVCFGFSLNAWLPYFVPPNILDSWFSVDGCALLVSTSHLNQL